MIYERILLPYFRRQSRRAMNFDVGEPGMPAPPRDGAAFLYVHVPFCPVLCPFCSFHRVEFRDYKAARYFGALRREIEAYRDAGFRFTGVYVGGGTPTVVPAELVRTLRLIRDSFPVKEVSVETNPSDLTDDVLSQLVDAGVDRLSVGVQSFDDNLLREMERYEKYGSSTEILARLDAAAGRFATLNVDMIFNLPHQTPAILDADLATVHACGANQVSFYPLMTSETVRKKMTARMGRLDGERVRQHYERILERLQPGFAPSSAWCFNRGGRGIDEYIVGAGDYVGVGSGAFSYVNGTMYSTTFSLHAYADRLDRGLPAVTRSRRMSLNDQMRYDLLVRLFGLRLDDDWLEQRYGRSFFWRLAPEMTGLNLLGAVRRDRRGWQLTERGMYLWVLMMSAFFENVNLFREGMRHNIHAELDSD